MTRILIETERHTCHDSYCPEAGERHTHGSGWEIHTGRDAMLMLGSSPEYTSSPHHSESRSQNPDGTHRRVTELPSESHHGLSRRSSHSHRSSTLMPPPAVNGSSTLGRSHTTASHRSSGSSRVHEHSASSRTREHTRASASGGRTVREHRPAFTLPTVEEDSSYRSSTAVGVAVHPSSLGGSSHRAPDPSRLVSTPAASRVTNRRVSELRETGPGGSSMVVGGTGPTSHRSGHSDSHRSSSHYSSSRHSSSRH